MPQEPEQTTSYAKRFLQVMDAVGKMARYRMPAVFKDMLHGNNLNMNQIRALHLIREQPGLSQKEIAHLLEITPAAVSNAMRDLEALGLLERQPDPEDARQMRLYLGEKGRAIYNQLYQFRLESIMQLLRHMSPETQQYIVEALEHALAAQAREESEESNLE